MSLIGQLNVSQSQVVAGAQRNLLMWRQLLTIDLRPVECVQIFNIGVSIAVRDARVLARDGL